MKKSIKWIIAAVLFAAFIIIAVVLYNNLKDKITPERFSETESTTWSETATASKDKDKEEKDYTAPDFTVYDKDGNAVKLSDMRGTPVVVNFWASWCYYCKEEMPDFNDAYKNNDDIKFMMLNVTDGHQETKESADKFIAEKGFDFPVYYDNDLEASEAYGASSLPMTLFIDKDGNFVTYAIGMISAEDLAKGIDMIK